jgi:hypothetical protein
MRRELDRLGQRADVLLDEIKTIKVARVPEPTLAGFCRWLWTGLTGGGWGAPAA